MGKSSKTTAIIAAVALVALLAIAYFAYQALAGSGAKPNPSATSTASASSNSSSHASKSASASASASASSSAAAASSESEGSADAQESDSEAVLYLLESGFTSWDDEDLTWSDLPEGKPIVVNFWATWCPYCVDEMDDYQALYEEFGDDITFVMIDVCDGKRETRDKAENYIYEHGYTFPVYYDFTGEVVLEFGVTAYPSTVIFTSDGQVEYAAAGRINAEQIHGLLESLT